MAAQPLPGPRKLFPVLLPTWPILVPDPLVCLDPLVCDACDRGAGHLAQGAEALCAPWDKHLPKDTEGSTWRDCRGLSLHPDTGAAWASFLLPAAHTSFLWLLVLDIECLRSLCSVLAHGLTLTLTPVLTLTLTIISFLLLFSPLLALMPPWWPSVEWLPHP